MRPVYRFLLWFFLLFLIFLAVAGVAGYTTYTRLQSELPDINPVLDYRPNMPLQIFSADGVLMSEIGERRAPLPINQIPLKVQQAFLAAEDSRFYEHGGVDLSGIARAAWANFRQGHVVQGASTITQQVARNFFLDSDQTFYRKLKEAMLALKIERHLDKPAILGLYLNQIYLGNGAYGVQAAAQRYFNKDIKDLPLSQIALLAALPKAPSGFNPLVNPERAKIRRDWVLRRMAKLGDITPEQARLASEAPLGAGQYNLGNNLAPYATEEVRQWIVSRFGEEAAYNRGLKVYTTIDSNAQKDAEKAVLKGLEAYDHRHGYRGPIAHLHESAIEAVLNGKRPSQLPVNIPTHLHWALVLDINSKDARISLDNQEESALPFKDMRWARRWIPGHGLVAPSKPADILKRGDLIWVRKEGKDWTLTQIPQVQAGFLAMDPQTGKILSMVGGYSFNLSKFNHSTQAWRQPGSSFKPFIYAAAMDADALNQAGAARYFTPASIVDDAPFQAVDGSGKLWRPSNYHGKYYGPSSLRQALTRSQNMVSIRVLQTIGLPYAREYMQRFGFQPSQLPNGLSLALGSASVTLLQMTSAYTAFANNGLRTEPYLIDKIVDGQGHLLTLGNCELCAKPAPTTTVLPPSVAFLTTSLMQDVIKKGTATAALSLGRSDIAGKTGTTNDSRDTWFLGFTPHLVAGVWVGYDQARSLGHRETGATTALPIWIDYMRDALKKQPEGEFPVPPDVVIRDVNPHTGTLMEGGGTPEYFLENYLPQGPVYVKPADTPPADPLDLPPPEDSVGDVPPDLAPNVSANTPTSPLSSPGLP